MAMVDKELLDEERERSAIWQMIAQRLAKRLSKSEGNSSKEIINVEHIDLTGKVAFID